MNFVFLSSKFKVPEKKIIFMFCQFHLQLEVEIKIRSNVCAKCQYKPESPRNMLRNLESEFRTQNRFENSIYVFDALISFNNCKLDSVFV